MLILYLATLLNSLIRLSGFCMEYLGFSIHIVPCHLLRVTVLPHLFQFGYFISLAYHIVLARPSYSMLNKSRICRIPDFRGKFFNISSLSIIFPVGFSKMAFIMLSYVPSIPTLVRVFNQKLMLDFVECFFCIY